MEKFQKKGFLIHNRIEKREKRWEVVRSDNMELRVRGYCSWIVYLREKWWKIQMVIENRSQETANSFLRRTKRMGRKKKRERKKEMKKEREKKKERKEWDGVNRTLKNLSRLKNSLGSWYKWSFTADVQLK